MKKENQFHFSSSKGRAMVQTAIRLSVSTDTWVRFLAKKYELRGVKNGNGPDFSRSISISPCYYRYISAPLSYQSHTAIIRRTSGRSQETFT